MEKFMEKVERIDPITTLARIKESQKEVQFHIVSHSFTAKSRYH